MSVGFPRQEYWSGLPCPPPGDLPNLGIKPRSPALQADSLPAETQGKPKNNRVGSLSLLQWIFPIQESNHGLLHCRQILYQLSHWGSPLGLSIYKSIKPLISFLCLITLAGFNKADIMSTDSTKRYFSLSPQCTSLSMDTACC